MASPRALLGPVLHLPLPAAGIKTVFDEKMASLSVLPSFLNLNLYLPVILVRHGGGGRRGGTGTSSGSNNLCASSF